MAGDGNDLVARNTRRFRGERNLSLGELARRSGVSKQTLSKVEAGVGNPTVDTLEALAAALGVPLRALLTEWGSPVFVQRRQDATWDQGPGWQARTLDRIYGSGCVRSAIMRLDGATSRRTRIEPHSAGTLHHAYVISGRVRLGPVDAPVELEPGDFARYPGDVVHVVERLGEEATVHVVTTAPQVPQFGSAEEPGLPATA